MPHGVSIKGSRRLIRSVLQGYVQSMATYLESGWYEPNSKSLRAEVVDGAMDIAGALLRGGVTPTLVQLVALKVRSFVTLANRDWSKDFNQRRRETLLHQVEPYTTRAPELDSFVADCLEHVHTSSELFALYLHLVHVTRMLEILTTAVAAGSSVANLTSRTSPLRMRTEKTSPGAPQSKKTSGNRSRTTSTSHAATTKKSSKKKKIGKTTKKSSGGRKTGSRKKAVPKKASSGGVKKASKSVPKKRSKPSSKAKKKSR